MKGNDLSQLKQKALEAKFSTQTLQLLFSILDRQEKGEEISVEEKQKLSYLIDRDIVNVEEDARIIEELVLALGEEKGRLEARAKIVESQGVGQATVPVATPPVEPTPDVPSAASPAPAEDTLKDSPVAEPPIPKVPSKVTADEEGLTPEEQAAIDRIQEQLRNIAQGKK